MSEAYVTFKLLKYWVETLPEQKSWWRWQYTRNLKPGRVARTSLPITDEFYAKAWLPYSQLDRQSRRLVLEYEQEETDLGVSFALVRRDLRSNGPRVRNPTAPQLVERFSYEDDLNDPDYIP